MSSIYLSFSSSLYHSPHLLLSSSLSASLSPDYTGGQVLTKIKMNAWDERVEEEHEDDNCEDGHTLDQENLVSYLVLLKAN